MTTTVHANGHIYTDDDNPVTGMGDGGFRERLLPMLSDIMIETNESRALADDAVGDAQGFAAAAATSAASAVGSPNTNGTSATSLSISNAVKAMTASTGKSWVVGMWVTLARSSAAGTAWMNGAITAYNSATGALTVDVRRSRGSGSATDWVITASAPESPDTGGASESVSYVVLTSNSLRYQAITALSSGVGALLPDPTASTQGASLYTLRNYAAGGASYGHDIFIATQAGQTLAYVPPDQAVSVDASVTGNNLSGAARSYGVACTAAVTFASVVAGSGGLYTKSLLLPSGDTLILVHGVSLHAVVYNVAGTALGAPVQLRTGMGAGGDGTVNACLVNDGSDNVIVSSVIGTALQNVMLTISSGVITAGTALSTTLASGLIRLVDVQPVGSASNRFALLGLVSATGSSLIGLELTGTTLVAGAVTSLGMAGSVTSLLTRTSDNVATVLYAAAGTQISARPYTVGAAGLLTVGATATLTTTNITSIAVRYDSVNSLWYVMHVNTTARVSILAVSATPAATFSTAVVFQSAVTTLSAAYGGGEWDVAGGNLTIAVTGTTGTGQSLAEVWQISNSSGTPVSAGSIAVYMESLPTATYLNSGLWQLVSAPEAVMVMPLNSGVNPVEWRMPGAATYSQLALPLDNTDIKATKARNTLRSSTRTLAVLDGTKPSMLYNVSGWAEATAAPVRLTINANNCRSLNGINDRIWAASGPGATTALTIQCLHLV